jgi:hypothetical protein
VGYTLLVGGVIGFRVGVIDEENIWYEYCAAPTTLVAMVQLSVSFPAILFSGRKTQEISKNLFKQWYNSHQNSPLEEKIQDIEFLYKAIPTFSNAPITLVASAIRGIANVGLQPVDLFVSPVKDAILNWGVFRWLTPPGVIEQQSKVANAVTNIVTQYLFTKVGPALIAEQKEENKDLDKFFHFLYQYAKGKDKDKIQDIYTKCTTATTDFDKPKINFIEHKNWGTKTYIGAFATLVVEYLYFGFNPGTPFFKNFSFYIGIVNKSSRFGSFIASTLGPGNKIIEKVTGSKLTKDINFQDLMCYDSARLIGAVGPLVGFELSGGNLPVTQSVYSPRRYINI